MVGVDGDVTVPDLDVVVGHRGAVFKTRVAVGRDLHRLFGKARDLAPQKMRARQQEQGYGYQPAHREFRRS